MTEGEGRRLLSEYLSCPKRHGRVVLLTPQEAGYRSDPIHVRFMNFDALRRMAGAAGLTPLRGPLCAYSFPSARTAGRYFRHNEFVSISRKVTA